MSNKIPSYISMNCEKVGNEWIVELYFPGHVGNPVWIAKDKNRIRAIQKAQGKLIRVTERLYAMEFPELKNEISRLRAGKIKVYGRRIT